jgi:hypothetical protein
MAESSKVDPLGQDEMADVDVVLEGGPATLPAELRSHRVASPEERVKVPHYGGYEHFEWDRCANRTPLVFRWTGRTRVAE